MPLGGLLPYAGQQRGLSPEILRLVEQFMGRPMPMPGPDARQMRPMMPQGVNMENMGQYARTPAGQNMMRGLMDEVRTARGQSQARRRTAGPDTGRGVPYQRRQSSGPDTDRMPRMMPG